MTATALQGRTDWETAQQAADHGKSAAQAIGYRCIGRYLHEHAGEDMAILGLREIPEPRAQMWPVTGGTDEDRRARVDAWAKRHGVTAGDEEESGTYRAVLSFGPVRVIAYMIPDRTMDERLAAIRKAVAEREAAA
jgi:hypothetical protein